MEAQNYLGVSTRLVVQGQAADQGSALIGASTVLARYGTGEPLCTFHIFAEGDGIKVKVDQQPFFSCLFMRVIS